MYVVMTIIIYFLIKKIKNDMFSHVGCKHLNQVMYQRLNKSKTS
jgi:hypothetical protein